MKKLYTLAAAMLLASNTFSQNGQFENSGLENWSDVDLYDYPTQWGNSNQQEYRGGVGVIKSTDAIDGTLSLQLGAYVANDGDTLSGYTFQGELDANGPSAGVPYASTFDEIRFQHKNDLQLGDSAFLIVVRSTGGTMQSLELYPAVIGSSASWTQTSIIINSGTQDSLFVGFILGSPNSNSPIDPSSWVRFDDVKMYNGGTAIADLIDPSFENWSVQTTEEPDAWFTANAIMVPIGGSNVVKSTDSNTGSYSAEMTTVFEPQNGDSIPAFLSNGPINYLSADPFSGAPYTAIPDTFSFAYKYAGSNGDVAALYVTFHSGGVLLDSIFQPLFDQATWQTIDLVLSLGSAPDTMMFLAYSGENPGSVLNLDNIEFYGPNIPPVIGLTPISTSMTVSMYPNPTSSTVLINAEGTYDYSIVDLAGNVVLSNASNNGETELNISDLSSGTYLVKINNEHNSETKKLIVE
jgi:hypothetical protein